MNAPKAGLSLSGTRKRYVIEDPQMYILLCEYEQIIELLQVLPHIHDQTPPQQRWIRKQHAELIEEGQDRLRQAKAFFHIKN